MSNGTIRFKCPTQHWFKEVPASLLTEDRGLGTRWLEQLRSKGGLHFIDDLTSLFLHVSRVGRVQMVRAGSSLRICQSVLSLLTLTGNWVTLAIQSKIRSGRWDRDT